MKFYVSNQRVCTPGNKGKIREEERKAACFPPKS